MKVMIKTLLIYVSSVAALQGFALTETVNGITWTYTVSNGEASLGTGDYYSGRAVPVATSGIITIPTTLGGCPVTHIESSAFRECKGLGSVMIPEGVTSIGDMAFDWCTNLTSITIPNSVTNIGGAAFYGCDGALFDTNSIPGVKLVDGWAIGYTDSLSGSLDLTGTRGISEGTFRNCTNLTSVTIGNGATSIGYETFRSCRGLTSVMIPEGVTSIGDMAFDWCTNLTSITIPNSVTSIGNGAFHACSRITSVTIGNGVTSIGDEAFDGCSGLTSVTIPNSVMAIGVGAFAFCRGLTNMVLPFVGAKRGNSSGADSLFGHVFVANGNPGAGYIQTCQYYTSSLSKTCYIPASLKEVTITDETRLGYGAFYNCSGLTSVTLSDSMTNIEDSAFAGCSELTSVTIPDGIISLPISAFDGCGKLCSNWVKILTNVSSENYGGGGANAGSGAKVNLTVTNVVVHYVTASVPSAAVIPSTTSGIVNVISEVNAGTAVAITADWAEQYPGFVAKFGNDFTKAITAETGKRDGVGKPMMVWQDFVAGTDPTNPDDVFRASLTFDAATGDPIVSWTPELSAAEAAKRIYKTFGKVRLNDPNWTLINGDAANYNFFKVTVEMR